MNRSSPVLGFVMAVVVGLVAAGGVYLTLRVGCRVFPDLVLLEAACESDPGGLAVVAGLGATVIGLAGWAQGLRRRRPPD